MWVVPMSEFLRIIVVGVWYLTKKRHRMQEITNLESAMSHKNAHHCAVHGRLVETFKACND